MTGNATKDKRLQSEKSEQRGVVDKAKDVGGTENLNKGVLQPPLLIRYTPEPSPTKENRVDKVGIKA